MLLIVFLAVSNGPVSPLTDDSLRYHHTGDVGHWLKDLLERTVIDLAAIPASVVAWDGLDYGLFATTAVLSVGPLVPIAGRSLDARLQDALHTWRPPNCGYFANTSTVCPQAVSSGFHVWTSTSDTVIMTTAIATPLLLLATAAIAWNEPRHVEVGALAIEAVLVTQAYHLTLKLLTGREGPLWHQGAGTFHGPSFVYLPDGYPSGHAATLFAIASVYAHYYDLPWLSVLLYGAATTLSVFLVLDDSHFLSEVLIGSAMGYFIGRWVVRHRSSLPVDRALDLRSVALSPAANGGVVTASFAW